MGYIPLEIIVKSAEVSKNVNLFSRMHLYATVSLLGDDDPSTSKQKKTKVDEHSGSHPFWWFPMKFQVDESKLQKDNLMLLFQLKCSRNFRGDKTVGVLTLSVKELYDSSKTQKFPTNVAHTINSRNSGRLHGVLYFSYMFCCDNGNETTYIDQRQKSDQSYDHQKMDQNSRNDTILSSAPVQWTDPTPSAPYIAMEDDEYFFATSPIDSLPNSLVNGRSSGSSITPSAPYLPS